MLNVPSQMWKICLHRCAKRTSTDVQNVPTKLYKMCPHRCVIKHTYKCANTWYFRALRYPYVGLRGQKAPALAFCRPPARGPTRTPCIIALGPGSALLAIRPSAKRVVHTSYVCVTCLCEGVLSGNIGPTFSCAYGLHVILQVS